MSELPIPSELVADLADRMSGRRWETAHAYNAVVALRAMPVEQRMVLMNMVAVGPVRVFTEQGDG